jgi:SagB-type dehydrogenase family enzyme
VQPIPHDEVRPVLATDPVFTDGGAEFVLDRAVVTVGDDDGRLRLVLDACDGRTAVGELTAALGPDARALVDELLHAGVLVDIERCWRRSHRLGANPPLFKRDVPDDEVHRLMAETFVPPVTFGDPVRVEGMPSSIERAARTRRSARPEPEPRPLQWEQLCSLLATAYGRAAPGWFTVPSGGALYPLVVHVLLRKPLGPLEPGIWWYDHWQGELRQTRSGAPDIVPLLVPHPVTDPLVAREEPLLAISADLSRTCRKYGMRGYRFALMETGAVMQTAYLVGAELDIPVRACAGYHDARMNLLLGHPDDVVCTLLLLLGT